MQAIVLVGGEGTRLRPLTDSIPKPALTLVDRPFLAYMVEWLAVHGVDEVVFACGFLPDVLREALGDGEHAGVRLTYVVEPERRGTAGAIRFAADSLGDRLGERFLALNGDVLCDLDLGALLRRTRAPRRARDAGAVPGRGLLRLRPRRAPTPTARSSTSSRRPARRVPGEINAGAYVLERSVLDLIPAGTEVSIEREIFPRLVGDGLHGAAARRLLDGHRHPGALPAGELGHPRGTGAHAGAADRAGAVPRAPAPRSRPRPSLGPRAVVSRRLRGRRRGRGPRLGPARGLHGRGRGRGSSGSILAAGRERRTPGPRSPARSSAG